MTKQQITETIIDVIDLLNHAKPGSGPSLVRSRNRTLANEKLLTLPNKWWNKIDDSLVLAFTDAER